VPILIASDAYPPGSIGGAAWSTHTLAQSLRAAGHRVRVVVPIRRAPPVAPADGRVPVTYHRYTAPPIPFVQNWLRHERLWQPLAATLVQVARQICAETGTNLAELVIHAQHVQVTPAAVQAGQQLGVPVVVTVRDHWATDYFATGLHANRLPYAPRARGAQQAAALLTDLVGREGAVRGMLAVGAIPYMLAHVRRRQAYLARADAVIAVSAYIARQLRPYVAPERLHIIPNIADPQHTAVVAAPAPTMPVPDQFLLFIGKLEANKGAGLLPQIMRELVARHAALPAAARPPLPPLLIAGTGALQPMLARELAASGVAVQFLQWVAHDDILRLLARCTVLLFPSVWGEPLSRVLLEAMSIGTPIVAMPTGGTPEIIHDGYTGRLAASEAGMAQATLALLQQPAARTRLGDAARAYAQAHFSVAAVLPQVLRVYQDARERR